MGTNLYFHTGDKELARKFTYGIQDEPNFHHEIQLAETSYGRSSLFHKEIINFVTDIKTIYVENPDKIEIKVEFL